MRERLLSLYGLALVGAAAVVSVAMAQSSGSEGFKSPASRYAISPAFNPSYKAPRTPYGQPDLQGVYNNFTYQPTSRPPAYADREFFSEAEASAIERKAKETPCIISAAELRYVKQKVPMSMEAAIADVKAESAVMAQQFKGGWKPCNPGIPLADAASNVGRGFSGDFYDFGLYGPSLVKSRRTSLVVDPPDGRMPPMTPLGQQLSLEATARDFLKRGPEDLPNAMRCTVSDPGAPYTFKNFPYSNFTQIFQSRDYVAFRHDLNTYPRIVPLDGRPPLPSQIKQWMGDSRGHWDGDTLVVETNNFRPDADPRNGLPPGHLIERFTRVDQDYLLYEMTSDNPEIYQPYTLHYYPKREKVEVFEFICHEANYNLPGELAEKRRLEKALLKK